ncbi:MAG TPA: Hsp20/alpha crystallin family protein [Vicinamibacteria bacterium]|jgi:HSP20 family protein|nr:Hsp20/alpha crystallin family protein [Vicinamibacteria bacterium]
MKTMLHWSPSRQLHFHHPVEGLLPGVFEAAANEALLPAESWLPATEGWIQDGTYVIQFALPGVDPKEVSVSLMDSVLTVKGARKADHDTTGKDYFVREAVYGSFQRSVALPEGVDAAQVEAKYTNGILEVRVPTPRAATPTTIEIKAA